MTCGEATQMRKRICINAREGVFGCLGNTTETEACDLEVSNSN